MSEKVNVLIVSDIVLSTTGVANQSAEVAKSLFNKGYGVFQIGVSAVDKNKKFLQTFPTGEQVTVYTDTAYDNVPMLLHLIKEHDIKCLILITDPHKFENIWLNARTIRNVVPVLYWSLWDSNLLPSKNSEKAHFNQWMYESCDSIPCISKQSENFVRQIINGLPIDRRPRVSYIPHGSNEFIFKPLPKDLVDAHRRNFFNGQEVEFVVFFNSRNQLRKKVSDLIYSWQMFFNGLADEQKSKTVLLLHTEPVSPTGTDLIEVINALAPNTNIIIDTSLRSTEEMNVLYNISDVTFNVSNAEGFGLSAQESLLAGTPIAATVTGGLQDSIGFFGEGGESMTFNKEFTSNNVGKYKNHGVWSYPMFPDCQSVIGSPATPYLFDDDVSHETIKEGLTYWHNIPREERKRMGVKGREYCLMMDMNSSALSELFPREVEQTINEFKPKERFEIYTA